MLHKFKKRILSLKLPADRQISDKQNQIFQKSKSYEISSIDINVDEDLEFIILVFSWCIPLDHDHEIFTKCKKTIINVTLSNHIKVISYYNICSGIKCEQAKKIAVCHSVPKTFDFSQNSSVPFHQVTFYRSISCVLLIEKPNESCRNCIKFERNVLPTTKKLLKRKEKNVIPAKTNASTSQTSSERLKVTIQTYRMENKELKMKLDNFKRKNITLHEVILGGAAKISTIFSK